jgi:hypothetical protein
MAGGAEEDLVPRCRSAMGVGCWIGRVVMRPKVGLGFDNPASQDMTGESVSTSSAWPSGVTLGKDVQQGLVGADDKRWCARCPITFLPYMFFSFITPN